MSRRHYSSSAAATTLTSSVGSSDTTIVVGSITGLPVQYPYTLILDPDTASEEVVDVTAGSSTTLTVIRGVDGTTALAHTTGAVVQHGVSARDFDEPNSHINASTGVHSVSGSVVGTSDTQTLTNKTLTTPTVTGGTFSAPALSAPTATGSLTGFGGAWTAFTPTLTNFTATVAEARYVQIGKTVHWQAVLSLTAAPTGNLAMSLPVTARTSATSPHMGTVHGYTGTIGRLGFLLYVTTTSVQFLDGSGAGNWNATVPFTWAAGHAIRIQGTYEAA